MRANPWWLQCMSYAGAAVLIVGVATHTSVLVVIAVIYVLALQIVWIRRRRIIRERRSSATPS